MCRIRIFWKRQKARVKVVRVEKEPHPSSLILCLPHWGCFHPNNPNKVDSLSLLLTSLGFLFSHFLRCLLMVKQKGTREAGMRKEGNRERQIIINQVIIKELWEARGRYRSNEHVSLQASLVSLFLFRAQ